MPRERPRTMYATIHRSATNTPYLSLKPVIYSLTDGTSIPAPADLDTPPTTPPATAKYSPFPSPASYGPQSIFSQSPTTLTTHASTSTFPNPLSSHPISPSASPSPSSTTTGPTFSGPSSEASYRDEDEDAEAYDFYDEDNLPLAVLLRRRDTCRSDRATIGNRASTLYQWLEPPTQPAESSLQRPRFVERFLRRRTAGAVGGRRRAESEIFPAGPGPEGYSFEGDEMLREKRFGGVRRAASYSVNLSAGSRLSGEVSIVDGEEYGRKGYGANTFPRMVRQKSLNLLSSAKRVSGNWWTKDDASEAKDKDGCDELETYMHKHTAEDEERYGEEEDEDVQTVIWEPPPVLPELTEIGARLDGGKLGGKELFDEIGRDDGEAARPAALPAWKRMSRTFSGFRG